MFECFKDISRIWVSFHVFTGLRKAKIKYKNKIRGKTQEQKRELEKIKAIRPYAYGRVHMCMAPQRHLG